MDLRGQAGFVGEDLIAMIVVVLAIAGVMVYVNSLLLDHSLSQKGLYESQAAWMLAENQAKEWSITGSARLLNYSLLCLNLPELEGYDVAVRAFDLRENQTLCERGPPTLGKVARLPVAIYYNSSSRNPGYLEITASKR